MLHLVKQNIQQLIKDTLNLESVVEYPKKGDADLAVPLFKLAKTLHQNPNDVYDLLKKTILKLEGITSTSFDVGFLNIYLDHVWLGQHLTHQIISQGNDVGKRASNETTWVMDYSSPNIAKRFSVGHLRSTVIGASLKRLLELRGQEVIGVNHLGDWGTQFGKMIVAYERYGDPSLLIEDPIAALQVLYVKFHEEELIDSTLTDQAREVFKQLEEGNTHYLSLWSLFKQLSMVEFDRMYALLGVSFEHTIGEAFYNDKMARIVDMLEQKGLLELDDDALIVRLGNDMPPALIKKKDGSTLYMTRDLAAAIYRYETYQATHLLYVVGHEQALHFKQLQAVLHLMGYPIVVEHIHFGLVLVDGKKMSTRKGKYKSLEMVIEEAVMLAKQAILEKNPNLEDQEKTAKSVAVGAIIYNDLKNEKHLNIEFNLANMLKFEGQTGPYIQYTGVRMAALLKHLSDSDALLESIFETAHVKALNLLLGQFDETLERAKEERQPSIVARYAFSLAQSFNSWYGATRLLDEDEALKQTHLKFVKAIRYVLNQCLTILGIDVLEHM
jgi:arginyl-tRNA synthetase